jgi:putative nucleotidyltransferase with HDIG domain
MVDTFPIDTAARSLTTDRSLISWNFSHCPIAAPWQIDWAAILNDYPQIQVLANCPQDPEYHAEGNVLIHTQMVCESLVNNERWQQLSPTDRSIVFTAALFHDIAKSSTTAIGEDGRLHARGHGRKGGGMVREILQELCTPFTIREAIVAIVELGSLPLWFWDRDRPQKSVIFASQIVRCDLLALMAESDIRGRICHDSQRLLDSVELFRDFSQEQGCFDRAFEFPSHHSRFIYFSKDRGDPDYHAYDDTQFDVILTCGIPGAGKNHWIEHNYPERAVISLDDIRAQLGILPTEEQGPVIQRAKDLAKGYLQTKTPFIWNATNLVRSNRSGLIRSFCDYGARVQIIYVEVPFKQVIAQNKARDRVVPLSIIERFRRRLEIPNLTEAHRVMWQVDVGQPQSHRSR